MSNVISRIDACVIKEYEWWNIDYNISRNKNQKRAASRKIIVYLNNQKEIKPLISFFIIGNISTEVKSNVDRFKNIVVIYPFWDLPQQAIFSKT